MSKAPDAPKRRPAKSAQADLNSALSEYREEIETSQTALPFLDLIDNSSESDRDWILRIALALQSPDSADTAGDLNCFLQRIRLHRDRLGGNLLSAAMSFLNAEDYEKRPWEDDSDVLLTALQYGSYTVFSLIAAALKNENSYSRRIAAKWLTKYTPHPSAVALLQEALHDPDSEVRWWAATHLSRLAPQTPGLVPVLVSALHGEWCSSVRLAWDFQLTGAGEAAEALGHLGTSAAAAVPALIAAIPNLDVYDAQLAARSVCRISSPRHALSLLTPLIPLQPAVQKVVDEIKQLEAGIPVPNSPEDPLHACFIARFMWRPGEDDYWKFRQRDQRGAF